MLFASAWLALADNVRQGSQRGVLCVEKFSVQVGTACLYFLHCVDGCLGDGVAVVCSGHGRACCWLCFWHGTAVFIIYAWAIIRSCNRQVNVFNICAVDCEGKTFFAGACGCSAWGAGMVDVAFFEQAVEVAATETERTYPGAARVLAVSCPRAAFGAEIEGRIGGGKQWVWLVAVDRRRQGFVVQGEGRL